MKRILLTSAGLTDSMKELFLKQINKKAKDIRILLVPCASTVNDEAREGVSIGIAELMRMGIQDKNIFIYNLNYLLSAGYSRTFSAEISERYLPPSVRLLTDEELAGYDAILFTGGNAAVLLNEVNRTGFNYLLKQAVERGLFYIGVSAGSMIAAGNFPDSLGYIPNIIIPHCEIGSPCGTVTSNFEIHLTNGQAVWINDENIVIIDSCEEEK